jgi:hypothetical protein
MAKDSKLLSHHLGYAAHTAAAIREHYHSAYVLRYGYPGVRVAFDGRDLRRRKQTEDVDLTWLSPVLSSQF